MTLHTQENLFIRKLRNSLEKKPEVKQIVLKDKDAFNKFYSWKG